MRKLPYNTTQLHPDQTFERHVFHRDQFAHFLRWTRVLNLAKIGMKILDIGCGSANLLEVFYRNRFKPTLYHGVDVRPRMIQKLIETWSTKVDFASFSCVDVVCNPPPNDEWDIISCFEVLEHIGKQNGRSFLKNISSVMNPHTILLLSTPVFDPKVGAADNHMIQGEVGEWEFDELKGVLSEMFEVSQVNGTFASKRDIVPSLTECQKEVFEELNQYYDSNLMSVIFAPLHPSKSRNCIWTLKIRESS